MITFQNCRLTFISLVYLLAKLPIKLFEKVYLSTEMWKII